MGGVGGFSMTLMSVTRWRRSDLYVDSNLPLHMNFVVIYLFFGGFESVLPFTINGSLRKVQYTYKYIRHLFKNTVNTRHYVYSPVTGSCPASVWGRGRPHTLGRMIPYTGTSGNGTSGCGVLPGNSGRSYFDQLVSETRVPLH